MPPPGLIRLATMLAFLAVSPAAQEPRELPAPMVQGPVALFGCCVEVLPSGERHGSPRKWGPERTVEVTDLENEIEVLSRIGSAGLHDEFLRLVLAPQGARAEAYETSDLVPPPLTDIGGIAVLLTDGVDAWLEFEITRCFGFRWLSTDIGRIHVGDVGVALALRLPPLPDPDVELFLQPRTNQSHSDQGTAVARGQVDVSGRRQGTWMLLDPAGRERLESTWRDGLLDGPVIRYDENGQKRGAWRMEKGAQVGTASEWYASGALRSTREYVEGWDLGPWVVHDEAGNVTHQGAVRVPRNDVPSFAAVPSPEERRAFQAELATFRTRR